MTYSAARDSTATAEGSTTPARQARQGTVIRIGATGQQATAGAPAPTRAA